MKEWTKTSDETWTFTVDGRIKGDIYKEGSYYVPYYQGLGRLSAMGVRTLARAKRTVEREYNRVNRTSNPSRKRATKRKSNPRGGKRAVKVGNLTVKYEPEYAGWGVLKDGRHIAGLFGLTKAEAKAAAKRHYSRVKELTGRMDRTHGGRSANPRSAKGKSTPWIPVKAIRFRDGKLDMKVSKTVKRSLVAGDRLGNPTGPNGKTYKVIQLRSGDKKGWWTIKVKDKGGQWREIYGAIYKRKQDAQAVAKDWYGF